MHKRLLLTFILLIAFSSCYKKSGVNQSCEVRQDHSQKDEDYLYQRAILPDKPLTLMDIIEIAYQLNLDLQVKELDWAIQEEVATGETLKMLPAFIYTSDHSHRNNSTASTQITPSTGVISPPLTSSTQTDHRWDYTLTWNLLDFGLSYFRSRAELDRAQVARFQYEKVKQNLVLNIYKSYWRAIAAKVTAEHSRNIIELSQKVQETVQKDTKERLISSLQGYQTQDQMLQIQKRLNYFENVYYEAKAELAGLMGIPAALCFELAPVELADMPELYDLCRMEEIALESRPELYGADFEGRISADQVHIELLQMFPTLSLFQGFHTDKNPFLVNSNWTIVGVQTVWNLLSLPQHFAHTLAAKGRQYQTYESRLALTIGVLSQVNLAYWKFQEVLQQYNLQLEIYTVQKRLAEATKKQHLYGEIGIVDVVRTEGDAISSEAVLLQLYGDLQIALEQINFAMGRSLLFNTIACDETIDDLEIETNDEIIENNERDNEYE